MPPFLRPVRALLLALLVLALADAALQTRVPPANPVPMPFREGASGFGPHGPVEDEVVRAVPGGWETLMHRQRISEVKAAPRLVVLGESAVAGGGLRFEDTFPALLADRLPGWEVLNLGAPARDSAQILSLLEWTLRNLRPDSVIVYCGNNEFHRLRAYRHFHPAWSSATERTRSLLQRLALYRWLAGVQPEPAAGRPLDLPLRDLDVTVTEDDRQLVRAHYRRNLAAMARACGEIPLLLCTVAVNEEFPPGWGRGPDPSEAGLLDGADLPALQRAVRARPDSAWLHHALGLAAREAGDLALARQELSQAVERNPRPDRALPSFRRIAAEVAAAEGAGLVDLEGALRAASPDGILGGDLFLDACHLTPAGNLRAAEELARRVPGPRG